MILDGKSFAEIADSESTSKRKVQDVVDLAMVAPDLLDTISRGEQNKGLTSNYLVKAGVSAVWSEQRASFARI